MAQLVAADALRVVLAVVTTATVAALPLRRKILLIVVLIAVIILAGSEETETEETETEETENENERTKKEQIEIEERTGIETTEGGATIATATIIVIRDEEWEIATRRISEVAVGQGMVLAREIVVAAQEVQRTAAAAKVTETEAAAAEMRIAAAMKAHRHRAEVPRMHLPPHGMTRTAMVVGGGGNKGPAAAPGGNVTETMKVYVRKFVI